MRLKLWLAIFLMLSSLAAPVVFSPEAAAVSGDCYFKKGGPVASSSGCAESGLGDYGTNDVLTGRSTSGKGWAIDPNKVNTKAKFIDFIISRYNGSDHNKIGASYLIQKMRGVNRLAALPNSSDIQDWKNRVNQIGVDIKFYQKRTVGDTTWYDNDKKNIFLGDHPNVSRRVIEIYQDGVLKDVIEHECGNMTATDSPITWNEWNLTPASTVDRNEAAPGDTITWQHSVTNSGPDKTTETTDWNVIASPSSIVSANPSGIPYDNSGSFSKGKPSGSVFTKQREYKAKDSDIGKTLCQWVTVKPNKWNDSSTQASTKACVDIVSVYNLTPEVTGSSGVVESGSQLGNVAASVKKSGEVTSTSTWQFGKVIYPPGATVPGQGQVTDNPTQPSTYYGGAWTQIANGSQQFTTSVTQVAIDTNPIISDTLPVGTQICWTLSVQPPSNQFGGWRHAVPLCVKVGKKPKIQILGGDLRTRGEISTSTSTVNRDGAAKTFGSWVEFGAFSVNRNSGFASGAGLRNGRVDDNQSNWSKLTYANSVPDPLEDGADDYVYGNFGDGLSPAASIADYFNRASSSAIGTADVPVAGLGSGIYKKTGNLGIVGGSIGKNKSIVIIATGKVTIKAANISYDSTGLNSIAEIPQLVIIADDIAIEDGISNVDAWLIASNSINTCASIADPENPALSSGLCGNPLTVNGPVATNKLYLMRTAGSNPGEAIKDPAEKFNLRPDAYLWGYNYGLASSHPNTVSVSELPPRF